MEPAQDEAVRGRLLLVAALVALAVATGLAFGRVYQGTAATFRLMVAGAGAVAIGAAFERRHILLSTVASGIGLLLAIGLLVFPETTVAGIPTAATFRALHRALSAVGSNVAREIAPVPPIASLLVAGIIGMWTAGFATSALAARAGSGPLAVLPAAALVAFTDVVVADGARFAYSAVFLAAAFLVLFAVGLRRVDQWGPVVPWSSSRRWGRVIGTTAGGARRAGTVAVIAAILFPWVLPGFRSPAVLTLEGTGSPTRASIDPIVDLRPSLTIDPPIEVFDVKAEQPAYWRLLSLDDFDGQLWTSPDLEGHAGTRIPGGAVLDPSSSLPLTSAEQLTASVTIAGLEAPWLPVPYDPIEVRAGLDDLRYVPGTSMLVTPALTRRDLTYTVTSKIVVPTPQELDRDFSDDPLASADSPETRLPPDTPAEVDAIARRITKGQETWYRQALAIQDFLRGFTYDERAPAGHDTNHLLFFLKTSRRGFCEQFAGSMAVLLRALGIPARVAIGFTPGVFTPNDGLWHVTTRNAHAWVEVHFGAYGWLPFEPTPSRNNPFAGTFNFPVDLPGAPGVGGPAPGAALTGQGHLLEPGNANPNIQAGGDSAPTRAPRKALPIATFALLAAGVALLALLAIPAVKGARRFAATRRGRRPAERVLAAYDLFDRRLADVGLGRLPAETVWEHRRRLRDEVTFSDGHLERLTKLVGRAAYGSDALTDEDAVEAAGAARVATDDARRSVGTGRRVVGVFRPRR